MDNKITENVNIRYGYNITFTGWTYENRKISVTTVEGDMAIRANFEIAPKTVFIYLILDTKDTFGQSGEQRQLMEFYGLTDKKIYEKIIRFMDVK